MTQRIIWDGPWKLVWNGFDFDELYHLDDDPYEMHNLIDDPGLQDRVTALMRYAWQVVRDTGDRALFNSHYPILRLAPVGPQILGEETPAKEAPMNERLLRYRSGGPVDLGYGLGTAPPLILRRGDRLDLMVGTDIWTMGRPGRPRAAVLPTARQRRDRREPGMVVGGAARAAAGGRAQDRGRRHAAGVVVVRSGDLRRYRVSYDSGWTFRPAERIVSRARGQQGLGTMQLLSEGGSTAAPHLLLGDNDWRQTQPVPAQWTRTCRSRRTCASAISTASGAGET